MNKSLILTCISAVGVITTGVLAARAAPKATKLLEEARANKGEELTNLEKIKTTAPVYIPAMLAGASTIACMFGANALNAKQQASMASAYALLDSSYKEYQAKVKELYGEDADNHVKEEMVKDIYEPSEDELPDGEHLFFDFNSMTYFNAKMEEVIYKSTMEDGMECYIITLPTESPLSWMREH
ncbi:DUF6353 family protein [Fibrobacter sp.]|uniref:DUF6353 family protein n=1 Tax=Fibrobacter sp. TaxID=35828 RepID=UPI00388E3B07